MSDFDEGPSLRLLSSTASLHRPTPPHPGGGAGRKRDVRLPPGQQRPDLLDRGYLAQALSHHLWPSGDRPQPRLHHPGARSHRSDGSAARPLALVELVRGTGPAAGGRDAVGGPLSLDAALRHALGPRLVPHLSRTHRRILDVLLGEATLPPGLYGHVRGDALCPQWHLRLARQRRLKPRRLLTDAGPRYRDDPGFWCQCLQARLVHRGHCPGTLDVRGLSRSRLLRRTLLRGVGHRAALLTASGLSVRGCYVASAWAGSWE